MKQPIFKATHIVKQFGPTIALNDVDIELYAGGFYCFSVAVGVNTVTVTYKAA